MREAIDKFFTSEAYAVVGVSRDRHKFGNAAFRAMKEKNLTVYPVNTHLNVVEEERCFNKITELPDDVQSVLIVVPPAAAEQVVAECKWKGIKNVWLQRGAESREAIAYARENGMNVIHSECILMFLEPVRSIHSFHRWVNKVVGKYPAAVHA